MSAPRIGAMLQPAWMRAASVFAESTSRWAATLKPAMQRVVTASEAAMDVLPALLTPASVVALVLGLWRVTADVGWTEAFLISNGLFSHWQVWIALAILLQAGAAWMLARRGSPDKISEEN